MVVLLVVSFNTNLSWTFKSLEQKYVSKTKSSFVFKLSCSIELFMAYIFSVAINIRVSNDCHVLSDWTPFFTVGELKATCWGLNEALLAFNAEGSVIWIQIFNYQGSAMWRGRTEFRPKCSGEALRIKPVVFLDSYFLHTVIIYMSVVIISMRSQMKEAFLF